MPLAPTDTRFLFRPLITDIVALLRGLSADDWERPTVAGTWRVRHVVAHLLDTALRRLSGGRDGQAIAPDRPIVTDRDLVGFINALNASWIRATERLSGRVLTDLYERAGIDLAQWFEGASLDASARLAVSWAGESESAAWFDIGREFTEIWHHGSQIRDAVGAGPFPDPRWLHAVLEIAVRVLPHAYRHTEGVAGQAVQLNVTGPSGGSWTLVATDSGWDLRAGTATRPTTTMTMSDESAWRLFFNALQPSTIDQIVGVVGEIALSRPLLNARSVIV
ncbi:MAG TPA: maleylpyruvate isomerase family mycothiol-dependent enzyme [Vicinamibacterales bacterium]